jgi:type II secretory pathway pseudopilin PulG
VVPEVSVVKYVGHPPRTRLRSPGWDGFSLVELLVTVVLAGMVFAAMVPMFILAQQSNAGDNMRTIALQTAQDKIEKIRQLDYDQIAADSGNPTSLPNLYNPAFGGSQFGPSFVADTGGVTKTLHIDYSVTPMPAGSPAGQEQYKKVIVDVYWDGQPAPVKHVILQTYVYRQYAGPQIVIFDVEPLDLIDENTVYITSSSVQLDATVNPTDITSMNAGGTPSGLVRFTVNAYNGAQVGYAEVTSPVSGLPGVYRYDWDASAAPDGEYIFRAVAFSRSRFEGNTVSVAYRLERGAPPAPTGLVAEAADELITLSWDSSPAGDLDHYELWRGDSSGGETLLADDLTSASYIDSGLLNGQTYYYYVKAIDDLGNASPASAEVFAAPAPQVDTVPPSVPGDFAVVKNGASQPSIRLSWSASIDSGTPTSGLLCHQIERSASGSGPWTTIDANVSPTAIAYIDSTAGWASTWYYRVRALDIAGNSSSYTSALAATTDPQPVYPLTVRNDHSTSTLYVRVQAVATGLWYRTTGVSQTTPPAEVSIAKKGKTATWSNLPAGVYNVFGRYSSSTTTKLGDVSAGATTVVFP